MNARFHPFVRLILAALGALLCVGTLTVVVFVALTKAAQIAHRPPTDLATFANANILLVTIFTYIPILLWLWFCRRVFDRQSFASLGLRTRGALRNAASGALCGVLAIGFLFAILATCGFVHINGFSPEFLQSGPRAFGPLFAYFLLFCCVGFTEEVLFRGYTFHNLSAWFGVRGALWAQAILFGAVHLGNVLKPNVTVASAFWDARWGILNIALIGAFFGLSYLKTGSLWFPIGFHAAWNFFLGCVFSLPVSGIRTFRVLDISLGANTTANGGQFGAEGSVFLVAIVGAMLWILRREPDDAQAFSDLATLRPAIWTDFLATRNSRNASAKGAVSADFSDDENASKSDDDLTHIPRFRTSMRPTSPRPSLQLGASARATSSTRNAFEPQIPAAFSGANAVIADDSATEFAAPNSSDFAAANTNSDRCAPFSTSEVSSASFAAKPEAPPELEAPISRPENSASAAFTPRVASNFGSPKRNVETEITESEISTTEFPRRDVRKTEIAPSEIAPSEIAPSEIAPSEIAPSEIAKGEAAKTELAGKIASREAAPAKTVDNAAFDGEIGREKARAENPARADSPLQNAEEKDVSPALKTAPRKPAPKW